MAVANRNLLIEVAKPWHIEHEAEERPEAEAAHLAAQEHSHLAPEAKEMQLTEEEDEKLVADVEADEKRHEAEERPEAEAAHLAAQEHSRLAHEAKERQLTEEEAEKLVVDAEAEEKRHEAKERPEAKAAHLAAQDHSHLANEANERQLTKKKLRSLWRMLRLRRKYSQNWMCSLPMKLMLDMWHRKQLTAPSTRTNLYLHATVVSHVCRQGIFRREVRIRVVLRGRMRDKRPAVSWLLALWAAGRLVCLMPSACLSLP